MKRKLLATLLCIFVVALLSACAAQATEPKEADKEMFRIVSDIGSTIRKSYPTSKVYYNMADEIVIVELKGTGIDWDLLTLALQQDRYADAWEEYAKHAQSISLSVKKRLNEKGYYYPVSVSLYDTGKPTRVLITYLDGEKVLDALEIAKSAPVSK